MAAADKGDLESVRALIAAGADVNADYNGRTALREAGDKTEIVAALRAAGAK